MLIRRVGTSGPAGPESTDFGTTTFPTNPIAYVKVVKKIAYATTP
jgi:hypothetical protein